MRRKIVLILALITAGVVNGQVGKWSINPNYDAIRMAKGADLIITDSIEERGLWTFDGKRLATTKYDIKTFIDDYALTTEPGSDAITGFFDVKGAFTSVTGYKTVPKKSFFSNGFTLVSDDEFFYFVDNKGESINGKYTEAYPFRNGYAACKSCKNFQKPKDTYSLLLNKDRQEVIFSYDGKTFDSDDIDFVSSVNDENVGIVIIKHKLYYFNGTDGTLKPVLDVKASTGDPKKDNKRHLKLSEDIAKSLVENPDSTFMLWVKCSKTDTLKIRFDAALVPQHIKYTDGDKTYNNHVDTVSEITSPMTVTSGNNKYGISWDGNEMLPPQFDEVSLCFNNKAFIKHNGKYGLLDVLKDEHFQFSMNKGNDVAFRHQKFETVIRLDLPKIISSKNTKIDMAPDSGCDVDMTSEVKKDTEFGNFIQYNCVLSIPKNLPDEMLGGTKNDVTYPVQVIYGDLKSPVIQFTIKAWHYKYFNVDIMDSETSINQGTLSLTFSINAERALGETEYPFHVTVMSDSLTCKLEKLSETRYKCKATSLKDGVNNIVVQIQEQGCPQVAFPFKVKYTAPVAKSENSAAVKEQVVVEKKDKYAKEEEETAPASDSTEVKETTETEAKPDSQQTDAAPTTVEVKDEKTDNEAKEKK